MINMVVSGILISIERELVYLISIVSYIIILIVVYYGLLLPCTDLKQFFDEFSIPHMLLVVLSLSLCIFPVGVFLSFMGIIGMLLIALASLGIIIGAFGIGIHIWRVGEITNTSEISTAGVLSIIGWFTALFMPGSWGLAITSILGAISSLLILLSYSKAVDNAYALFSPKYGLDSKAFDELLNELSSRQY